MWEWFAWGFGISSSLLALALSWALGFRMGHEDGWHLRGEEERKRQGH